MPAYIAKQPNGLYCRFSSVVDTVTHTNLTEKDVVDLFVEMAVQDAKERAEYVLKHSVHDFKEVMEDFMPYNNTIEEIDELVKEMGQEEGLKPEERERLEQIWKEFNEDFVEKTD